MRETGEKTSIGFAARAGRQPAARGLAFLAGLAALCFRRGESRRPRRPGFAPALPLLSLVSLLLLALPPLVPEAKAQSEIQIFSKTVTLATSGAFTGYRSGSHGSIAPNDDFDIDGTAYTVSRIEMDTGGSLYLEVRDSRGDGRYLPDDSRFRLRIEDKPASPGDPVTHTDFTLGQDARNNTVGQYQFTTGSTITQGQWSSGHAAGDMATVRLIWLPRPPPPPPGNAIWSQEFTTADTNDFFGFIHRDHPATGFGGELDDDDFDLKDTTYTVWRLTQNSDNDPNFWVTFTVAAGRPAAVTRLEGESELILRLMDAMGRSADLDFGEATYSATGNSDRLGYVFNNPPDIRFIEAGVDVTASILRKSDNAPPTASDGAVTTGADTDYAFAAGDFGFTDPFDELASVKVASLPPAGRGSLLLDGTAIAAADLPQTVTADELDAGALVYRPQPGAVGAGFARFTFRVNDGTSDSADAYTMTVDVAARPPPAVPEAFWSATVRYADVEIGGHRGFVHDHHPLGESGGTISDEYFDIDGTTYTVWRITQATDGSGTYFTVAAGATPATVRLPDEDRLILRVMGSDSSVDLEFSDATFEPSGSANGEQGYFWAKSRVGPDVQVGAVNTIALIRKPPPPPPPPIFLDGFWSTSVTPANDGRTAPRSATSAGSPELQSRRDDRRRRFRHRRHDLHGLAAHAQLGRRDFLHRGGGRDAGDPGCRTKRTWSCGSCFGDAASPPRIQFERRHVHRQQRGSNANSRDTSGTPPPPATVTFIWGPRTPPSPCCAGPPSPTAPRSPRRRARRWCGRRTWGCSRRPRGGRRMPSAGS